MIKTLPLLMQKGKYSNIFKYEKYKSVIVSSIKKEIKTFINERREIIKIWGKKFSFNNIPKVLTIMINTYLY